MDEKSLKGKDKEAYDKYLEQKKEQNKYREYVVEFLNNENADIDDLLDFYEWQDGKKSDREKVNDKDRLEYLSDYQDYVNSFASDEDTDLTTMENFVEWIKEEVFEKKIRCPKCDSFNTMEQYGKKVCEDCNDTSEITENNFGNSRQVG
jgi:hypothetical protein